MNHAFIVDSCPKCRGAGVSRNTRHFFYGISLIACGLLCFFQWPPTDGLFAMIWAQTGRLGWPAWIGSVIIWTLTGVPAVMGLGFVYAWLQGDTCSACNGRGKATCLAPKPKGA